MRGRLDGGDKRGRTLREGPSRGEQEAAARVGRERLFDQLTRHDESDKITSAYLEGRDIPLDTIRAVIREQTLKRHLQPVLCGSGREHIGIQPLMDACCWYLPSPLDRPPLTGTNPSTT